MSHGFTARATWALEVPPGDVLVPVDQNLDFPVAIKVSMAAIDPTQEAIIEEGETAPRIPRSTLKMVRLPPLIPDSDDEGDDDDITPEQLADLQALIASGDESSPGEEDEPVAGPSKSKSKNGVKKLTAALKGTTDNCCSDEEMACSKSNGVKKNKGKSKATQEDDEESESDLNDSDAEDGEPHVAVLCTLDTERNYQQPLDIILPVEENVGFIVTGTHSVFITGNLVTHFEDDDSGSEDGEEEEEDYDLEPDSDEMMGDSDDESDVLDTSRVTEVDSEDEEDAPALVTAPSKKGSKKRPAEEEAEGLDDMMKAEEKMSKKQLKKMKTNKGDAISTKDAKTEAKPEPKKDGKNDDKADKSEKKVKFAKNLEQGPTGSEAKKTDDKKPESSITVIKGIKIDDRKVGNGRKAKNGDKVSMRYIGKLESGKVFDANKKGPPFTFKLGKGEVIKGWEVGVAGMAVGGERRLTVPPSSAYGNKTLPGIPPNSTLIFDVKLLEIK